MAERKYQSEQVNSAFSELSTKRKVILQLPTGGGKTYEFSLITQKYIRGLLNDTESSVLILVHRKELMSQAAKTIKSLTGINPTLIVSGSNKFIVSRVYIGMVESTISRTHLMHNIGLVIIDECHIGTFNKVHSIFIEEMILGFSATPISSSKKEPMNKYYNSIVTGPHIRELIEQGYLAQNMTRCPEGMVDASKFDIDTLKGEYNEKQMATEYKLPKNVTNLVKNYHKFCFGEKTIVFNVNIEHSREVAECLRACGFNARHLASDNEHERDEIMYWFKITKDAILCNCMIATVGFDEPTVLNVMLNFSTLSLAKFLQCSGRGGRIIDDEFIERFYMDYPYRIGIKKSFNIIDMGGNSLKFGEWHNDRDWEYIFQNPDRAGDGIAPVKTCPKCEGLVHAAATVCNLNDEKGEYCGYEFVKPKTAEEQDLEEMILITKGIDVDKLINKNAKKYDYYTFFDMGFDCVEKLFEEYENPSQEKESLAFKGYYKKCCEWWNRHMAGKKGNKESIEDCSWHIRRAKNNFDNLVSRKRGVQSFKEVSTYDKKTPEIVIKENPQPPVPNSTSSYVGFLGQRDYAKLYGR